MTYRQPVLFLDIDGVCTAETDTPGSFNTHELKEYGLSPSCMSILKNLINELNAVVVISSSWRNYIGKNFVEYKGRKIPSPLPNLQKVLKDKIVDFLPKSGYLKKTIALKEFISKNSFNKSFVILDDDLAENIQNETKFNISKHFYKVNPKYGLTANDKDNIKKLIAVEQ